MSGSDRSNSNSCPNGGTEVTGVLRRRVCFAQSNYYDAGLGGVVQPRCDKKDYQNCYYHKLTISQKHSDTSRVEDIASA
ncbi:MAG: hypothetical protein WCP89_00990 [archaeon]